MCDQRYSRFWQILNQIKTQNTWFTSFQKVDILDSRIWSKSGPHVIEKKKNDLLHCFCVESSHVF